MLNLHAIKEMIGENRGEMGRSLVITGKMATLQYVWSSYIVEYG